MKLYKLLTNNYEHFNKGDIFYIESSDLIIIPDSWFPADREYLLRLYNRASSPSGIATYSHGFMKHFKEIT